MILSVWINALITGTVSTCSMPLGSLTSFVWTPQKRMLAFLMAFGGGALLAALVIDLVGSAIEQGHIWELVVGSILGSLFFSLINQIVNNSGGFLRKPSTILTHLSDRESRRFIRNCDRLKNVGLLQNLSPQLRQQITSILLTVNYPQGTILYRLRDSSESLYIVEKGKVELLDTQGEITHHLKTLSTNEILGHLAFLTGSPHQTQAIVRSDCQLLILPRSDFEKLLEISPELLAKTIQFIQQEQIKDYLHQNHQLSIEEIKDWVGRAIANLQVQRKIEPAVTIEQKISEFLNLARTMERFPIFNYLPQSDLEAIAERLVYRVYQDRHIFFEPEDYSDRLYIIHHGTVEIIYPDSLKKSPLFLSTADSFGELSLITEGRHTVSAIALTHTAIWTLRKQDIQEMLHKSPSLEKSIRNFLEQGKIKDYLQNRQHFEQNKAGQWVQKALISMDSGKSIPSVARMSAMMAQHKDAPMAIWLGLLMDGIPEALTIGAHQASASHTIGFSLLAGLLLSNYPEALSSSEGMKEQGFSKARILAMWISIMLITGILAAVGSQIFVNAPESIISFLGAIAAGAMLTVISETMLPEAYAKGGSIVGISTLLGFLSIIIIKNWG